MRNPKPNLKQELLEHAPRFEFFEAARLLQLLASRPATLGGDLKLRFRTAATKNFPAGEIHSLELVDKQIEVLTNIIGLHGPTGVLPHQDKDLVAGGAANLLLRDFLDVFNSRIISLFYEAWKTNRQDVSLEMFQRHVSKREDACTLMLLSLCGEGLKETRHQRLFSDDVFASSAGQLSRNVRTANGIGRCLAKQFRVAVEIREFVAERLFLPRQIQTRLGAAIGTPGWGDAGSPHYNVLGRTAIVGEAVPAHRQRFEIKLGPLSREQFEGLCPYDDSPNHVTIAGDHTAQAQAEQATARAAGRSRQISSAKSSSAKPMSTKPLSSNVAFLRFVDLVKTTVGKPLDFDVRFEVGAEAVTPARLGSWQVAKTTVKTAGTRLGFDTWLGKPATAQPRQDTVKRFTWDITNN